VSTVPYDNLFHLFMIFNTSKGQILFEKNARINASTTIPAAEDSYNLTNVPNKTLNDYIQTAKIAMGPKFFPYHPNTNNCQDFIKSVLLANGINDQNAINFVKQDTSMIFKNQVYLFFFSFRNLRPTIEQPAVRRRMPRLRSATADSSYMCRLC
jgi:hypothetical protein